MNCEQTLVPEESSGIKVTSLFMDFSNIPLKESAHILLAENISLREHCNNNRASMKQAERHKLPW